MYAAHLALGLALKGRLPDVPALPVVMGVGLLDVLNGAFVAAGLGHATPDPAAGPYLYFRLTGIGWDHSVAMAFVWAAAWAACFARRPKVAAWAAIAVASHLALDWPVHNGDLAWLPTGPAGLGGGLWDAWGPGAWLAELALTAALAGAGAWAARARGVDLRAPAAAVLLLGLSLSPWTSPMRLVGSGLLYAGLTALGFLVPGLALARLIDRAEGRARG